MRISNEKILFTPLLLLLLLGCSYEYMSRHAQKTFRKNRRTELYEALVRSIREKDPAFRDTTGKVIYVEPVIAKRKSGIGVYGYNYYATHFGSVDFLTWNGSEATLLYRGDYAALETAVVKFLKENNFSEREIKLAKTRLKVDWDFISTDVF